MLTVNNSQQKWYLYHHDMALLNYLHLVPLSVSVFYISFLIDIVCLKSVLHAFVNVVSESHEAISLYGWLWRYKNGRPIKNAETKNETMNYASTKMGIKSIQKRY